MTLFCHTWQPLGLRFEIFKVQHSLNLIHLHPIESRGGNYMNPLHRTLECRLDISKADLKISIPVSYYDLQLRATGLNVFKMCEIDNGNFID